MKIATNPKTSATLRDPDSFCLSLFLSLSLQNVLLYLETIEGPERDFAIEQVVASVTMLFPKGFDA